MPLIPAHYYRSVCCPFLCGNRKYQNALKCPFGEVNPQEVRDQSRTSVFVWLVFSPISLLASEHRWRFICCLFPLDSFSFSIPIVLPLSLFPPSPPSLKSLSASRSPVPHRALIRQFILFLWAPSSICGCDSQSPRRGSIPSRDLDTQPCQRCSINPPLSPLSCDFFARKVLGPYILLFPHARKV